MTRIVYRAVLTAPALFAQAGADPNTLAGRDRVAGSAVLGALAARWLAEHRPSDPAMDPDFRRLFLDGSVRYLHLHPEGAGERLQPTALSFWQPARSARIIDLAAYPEDELDPTLGAKPLPAGTWWRRDGQGIRTRVVRRRDGLHHARDRELQRPTERSGALFHYDAIDAGESFLGAIEMDDDADAAVIESLLLQGPLRLGRSRSAEYGGMAGVEILPRPPRVQRPMDPPDDLVVTLLSEYVGRNDAGETSVGALEADLAAAIGAPLVPRRVRGRPVRFVRQEVLDGWVGAWRMPRPPQPVLAAGSVLLFERPAGAIPATVWVGERNAEGYGRVALDLHGYERDLELVPIDALPASGEAAAQGALGAALLEQWLVEQVPSAVASLRLIGDLSPSALGALRQAVRTPGRLRIDKASKVAERLARCRVRLRSGSHRSLLDVARNLSGDDTWNPGDYVDASDMPPALAGSTLPRPADTRVRRALLDALLDRARREAQGTRGER